MNNLKIMSISGVDCYEKDGVAYLKLESVARGLGFTEIAASGNECVRWRTVKNHLANLGIATSCDGDIPEYIPENIFYRLAMKAKNAAAEAFQAKVADEIIPSIRKHGAYMNEQTLEQALTSPDFLIRLAQELKSEKEARQRLEKQAAEDAPKVLFAKMVETAETSILIGDLAKFLKQNGINTGQNRLFEWMRGHGYLVKNGASRNMPTQKAMEMGLFEVKESTTANPDGTIRLHRTTKVTGKGQVYFIKRFLAVDV